MSDFVPPDHDPVIETFSKLVKADLTKLRKNKLKVSRPNMNVLERREITVLKENKSITIKQADKGRAIVVINTLQYRKEIMRQSSDCDVYGILSLNSTQRFKLELLEIIDEALLKGTIDEKLAGHLKFNHPIGRGSLFNRVAIFLDRLMRKFAMAAPSYTRDTNDFIKSFESIQVNDSTFLVSFNVVSLYNFIEHDKDLAAVDVTLAGSDMAPDCAQFDLMLLEFILRRNYFFGDDYYLQCQRKAMGSNVAPTYANIYMAILEGEQVYGSTHWRHVSSWRCYIDNIFLYEMVVGRNWMSSINL
ncbi:unnamed protein product [Ranitomeya imitator]|uniref:Uncharacterized protein n=1 Tax=Ranitomeya imitator TaxID=111125 RepID=A0ABN9L5B8_9NEOB|nr:unnamed protein product [Ranitomeya imitator]